MSRGSHGKEGMRLGCLEEFSSLPRPGNLQHNWNEMLVSVLHVEILMEGGIKHFMNAGFHFVIYCPQTLLSQNLLGKKKKKER